MSEPKQYDKMSDDMAKRIQAMIDCTWDVIAGDWLDMHKNVIKEPCTIADAVEGVCDAERYLQYGEDPEAAVIFGGLPYEEMKELAIPVLRAYANKKGFIR